MANNLMVLQSLLSIAFAATISASHFALFENETAGFSVDLINRDSPLSPLYDHSLTPLERWTNSLRRSFKRAHRFSNYYHKLSSASTPIVADDGQYLMQISIGSPPFPVPVIIDTGSDLIWTECQPCVNCFKQKTPLFNPIKSSTYRKTPCQSQACKALPVTFFCDSSSKSCRFDISYGDESFSKGNVAIDTITLGTKAREKVTFRNIIFGCGHTTGGDFGASSGVLGLGRGKTSLVSQIGSSIRRKFSYCMMPFSQTTKHSTINFGDNGVVSGPGVVTTPIAQKSGETFYYLTLEGISVGRKRLKFKFHNKNNTVKIAQEGNIFIDSGTTLSFLPSRFYRQLESQVRRHIGKPTVPDPTFLLDLCYATLTTAEMPTITMHFKGGDVTLQSYNAFIKTSRNSTCLAFDSKSDVAIYGNIAQINFLVGYDLQKQTISFKPTDCTK